MEGTMTIRADSNQFLCNDHHSCNVVFDGGHGVARGTAELATPSVRFDNLSSRRSRNMCPSTVRDSFHVVVVHIGQKNQFRPPAHIKIDGRPSAFWWVSPGNPV